MRTTVNGIEVEYFRAGNGPDFLILHGWGRGIHDWQRITQALSKNFRVWVIDLPGFGKSQLPPESWGIDDYSQFVDAFIRARGIAEVTILAHSFGGRIAIGLASNSPSYLKKLILADSAGIRLQPRFVARALRIIVKIGKILLFVAPQKQREKVEYFFFKELAKRGIEYAQYLPLRAVFKRVVENNLEPLLEKIAVPTLLVWGENDNIVPVSVAKTMNEKIKDSTLKIIPGASHFPYFEKETEFLAVVQRFLLENHLE